MWTGRQQAAGPALAGLAFSLSILSEHACVYVYCISVGVRLSECTVIARLITRHFPTLKLGRTAAKTRICTFSSLREGPCKPLHNANRKPVPAQLSLWPLLCVSLSPLCSRNTSDTSTTQAEGRRRRRKNNWLALSCDM